MFFLESPARDIAAKGQSHPVNERAGAQPDGELFPVSAVGGLGHLDPGLPGAEADLANPSTSAGRGTVPHRQVDLFLLLFLRF
jgi:hypothetical protein